jgi:hypothetical protein
VIAVEQDADLAGTSMTEPTPIPQFYRVRGSKGRSLVLRADTPDELCAQIAKLRWKVIETEKAETHQRAICGSFGAWSSGWAWYGSYEELDFGAPILKTCSDACRKEADRLGLVTESVAIDADDS